MKDGGASAAPLQARPFTGRPKQSSFDDMEIDAKDGARPGSYQDGRFGFGEPRDPPRGPRRRY